MIIGIPSTGSAGLIQTIQAFAQGHLVAGILGTVATVGWVIQGVGLGFYYRQVCVRRIANLGLLTEYSRRGPITHRLGTLSKKQRVFFVPSL